MSGREDRGLLRLSTAKYFASSLRQRGMQVSLVGYVSDEVNCIRSILEPGHQRRGTTSQHLATIGAIALMPTTSCDELRVALRVVGHAPAIFGQQRCRRLKIDDNRSVRKRRLVKQSTLAAASLIPRHHARQLGCAAAYLPRWYDTQASCVVGKLTEGMRNFKILSTGKLI